MFRRKGEPVCRKVRGMLSEYIDNRLDGENKSLVERHLETCEACSNELESLRVTVQLLHRVPEVSAPRSFTVTVPQPRRESAFGPASMRWLRPATAIVAIALVVLLMGDFLFGFEHNARSNSGPGNVTLSAGQLAPSTVGGNLTGAGGVVPPEATPAPVPTPEGTEKDGKLAGVIQQTPAPSATGNEGTIGAQVIVQGKGGVGWPLRQTEIGLGAAVFVLLALTIYARRQRRKKAGAR
jgi:hypothetical protein